MQKNEFEKQVQHQLEDFSVTPANVVWQKVEAELIKDKHRRRVLFFWMFAGILLVGGITGFWLTGNHTNTAITSPTPVTVNESSPNNNVQSADNLKKLESTSDEIKEKQTPGQNNQAETFIVKQNERADNPKRVHVLKNKRISTYSKTTSIPANPIDETKLTNNEIQDANPQSSTINIAEETSSTIESQPIQNLTEVNTAAKLAATDTASFPTNPNQLEIKKGVKKNNSWHFGAMLMGGISDNISSFKSAKSDTRFFQSSNPGGSSLGGQASQSPINYAAAYNYKSSFSWAAGAFMQKAISKRTGISIGLNYQVMSANIIVGAKIDSPRTFQDSALMTSATVGRFYTAGKSNEYKNKYHLLQVPVNMLFQLNRNPNKPLHLSTGFTGGILLGSDALYLNYRSRSYYKETEQLKRFMLSAQTGLTFTFLNQQKYQFQAGPQLQYQLSNLTKPAAQSNEHLWFLGIKANLLFKSLNK